MDYWEFKQYCLSDLFRYEGQINGKIFLKYLFFHPGFKVTYFMRLYQYLNSKRGMLFSILSVPIKVIYRHYSYKYGIQIDYNAKVGKGLYIGHFGSIVVNPRAVIGSNCNISQGVTIGQKNRGKCAGYPVIGDCVYIGPGAKIIGGISIGNNVAIGANCVATKNIPDNAVVVGVPGRVISYNGSEGYVNNISHD